MPGKKERLVKYGSELILLSTDPSSGNISYRKFDYNEVVCQNKNVQLPDPANVFYCSEVMESLPLVVVGH